MKVTGALIVDAVTILPALAAFLDLPTSPAINVIGSIIVMAIKGLETVRLEKPALHRRRGLGFP